MCTSKSSTFCVMNCNNIFSQAAYTCIKLCTKQVKASNIRLS